MNMIIDFTKKDFNKDENIYKFDNEKYNFKKLIKDLLNNYYKKDFDLNKIHEIINEKYMNKDELDYFKKTPIFGKTDRDSIFIEIYHNYFDTFDVFANLYNKFMKEYIKPKFFPKEDFIVIQKTPNLRIQIPNKSNLGKRDSDPNEEIIGVHYDAEFDHSLEEINLIIPLTRMFDTNSIYHEYSTNSNLNFEDYNSLKLQENEIAFLYLNMWKHYNKINKTNLSRVSFDTRIIPYSKFKDSDLVSITSKKKFSLNNYYIKI